MNTSNDVIIIGAGIIGCSIAYWLAREGVQVTVIERGQPGQEASWAAAGMLSPYAEVAHSLPAALIEMFEASHALYPDFVADLEEATGIQIGYETMGSVVVAEDYEEAKMLAGLFERAQKTGRHVEELSPAQRREMEPDLAESIEATLYFPGDSAVNSRRLMTALVQAASGRGVRFLNGTPVAGLRFAGEKVTGVCTSTEAIDAGTVINTAGCWAGRVDPAQRIGLPVRPIRGQMVRLEMRPQSLHRMILASACYLIPWPDGRVLVGSTVENVGFNKEVTAQGIQQLLAGAVKVVPELANAPVRETWAGLRPDTPDNLPILGRTRFSNYLVATGHFRNGILLAPLTAAIMTELVVSNRTSWSLEPFQWDRFGSTVSVLA